jgi:hypothetical protein
MKHVLWLLVACIIIIIIGFFYFYIHMSIGCCHMLERILLQGFFVLIRFIVGVGWMFRRFFKLLFFRFLSFVCVYLG